MGQSVCAWIVRRIAYNLEDLGTAYLRIRGGRPRKPDLHDHRSSRRYDAPSAVELARAKVQATVVGVGR